MPKTSHPFQLSLLVLAVSAVLVSGCNSSDNDDDLAPEAQVTGLPVDTAPDSLMSLLRKSRRLTLPVAGRLWLMPCPGLWMCWI